MANRQANEMNFWQLETRCGRSPDRATQLTEGLPDSQETFGRCFWRGRENRAQRGWKLAPRELFVAREWCGKA